MRFRITPAKGNTTELQRMKLTKEQFQNGVRVGLLQAGQDMTRYAMTGIERGEKTGIQYKLVGKGKNKRISKLPIGYRGRVHQASAPGEFPAILTADYKTSIGFSVQNASQLEFGSTDKKAEWLEKGTKNMEPRPALSRAFFERQKNVFNYLRWERILRNKNKQ